MWQTYEELKISVNSIIEATQFLLWHQVNVKTLSKTGLVGKDLYDGGKIIQVWLTLDITIMLLEVKKFKPIANGNVADSGMITLKGL